MVWRDVLGVSTDVLPWLVAFASAAWVLSRYRLDRRREDSRIANERVWSKRLEEERHARGQAQRQEEEAKERARELELRDRERRERAEKVCGWWGNDEADGGDLEAGAYGAIVLCDTLGVRFAHVTVRHHNPEWVSKKGWGDLGPGRIKWSARQVYRSARGLITGPDPTPEQWEDRAAHDVEVTFLNSDGFWLHGRNGVQEMRRRLVIWAERTRADALRRHIETGFVLEYGVEVYFQEFETIEGLQDAFDSLASPAPDDGGLAVPDVIVGPHDWLGRAVGSAAVDEIRFTEDQAANFHPRSLAALTRDGRRYAIPYVFDTVALIANRDLARVPATFDELERTGRALLDSGAVETILALQVGEKGDPYHLWPLFASVGGTFFGLRDDGAFDEPAVWRPGFVTAFSRIAELGVSGRNLLSPRIGRTEALRLFRAGRAPFLVCSTRALAGLPDDLAVDVGPVPPLGDQVPRPMVSVYGFFIYRGAANSRIAQDLVTHYLARADTGEMLHRIQPRPPVQELAMRKVAASDPRVAPYIQLCRDGILMPSWPQMREVWDVLGTGQQAVIAGGDPVRIAEDVADEGWRRLGEIRGG